MFAAVRVLFFNEGNAGSQIMGLAQGEAAIRAALPEVPQIEARFATLTPMGRLAVAAATRPVPVLAGMRLDFRRLRWHVVQSSRARMQLAAELAAWPADAVYVKTQSVAMAMGGVMRRVPVAVSIDSTVRQWWEMPAWQAYNGGLRRTIVLSSALERRALSRAAIVLAWTPWARRGAETEIPRANVVEHHPGIDLRYYAPAPRRPRERSRVLFVGGRFVEKGGEDLLAALGERIGRDVDVDLVTPTDLPERPGVRVHALESTDPRLLDLYQQADLLVLPTYGDTNPWVLLEAMACGTPVVSTRLGGIPDMLDEGRAGRLVPHGDRRELARGIDSLLDDPAVRADLGARARARCESVYDARRQLPRLAELLEAITPGRAIPELTRQRHGAPASGPPRP